MTCNTETYTHISRRTHSIHLQTLLAYKLENNPITKRYMNFNSLRFLSKPCLEKNREILMRPQNHISQYCGSNIKILEDLFLEILVRLLAKVTRGTIEINYFQRDPK